MTSGMLQMQELRADSWDFQKLVREWVSIEACNPNNENTQIMLQPKSTEEAMKKIILKRKVLHVYSLPKQDIEM